MGALHRETFLTKPSTTPCVPYPAWRVQGSNPDWLPFAPLEEKKNDEEHNTLRRNVPRFLQCARVNATRCSKHPFRLPVIRPNRRLRNITKLRIGGSNIHKPCPDTFSRDPADTLITVTLQLR